MYPELLLYLDIGSFSSLTIARWYANEKSMIDLQKSNNAPYQNVERMDEAVNQTVQYTRDKLFSLSNVLYW